MIVFGRDLYIAIVSYTKIEQQKILIVTIIHGKRLLENISERLEE